MRAPCLAVSDTLLERVKVKMTVKEAIDISKREVCPKRLVRSSAGLYRLSCIAKLYARRGVETELSVRRPRMALNECSAAQVSRVANSLKTVKH
jgi:hypothetical protein